MLLRVWDSNGGTQWIVTSDADATLATCDTSIYNFNLRSRWNPQPVGSAPTAPAYSAGGWEDYDANDNRPIRVTPGAGR